MNSKLNKNLTPEQHHILREEGTEPPGSSPLNQEKREGHYPGNMKWIIYLCLVFSKQKPTCTLDTQEQSITVKNVDYIFDDGPKPTGKRFCNNGLCLIFKPKK